MTGGTVESAGVKDTDDVWIRMKVSVFMYVVRIRIRETFAKTPPG